jgi:replicative DNA helicase
MTYADGFAQDDANDPEEIPGLFEIARTMERQLLAAIMAQPDHIGTHAITVDDFADDRHRAIFRVMARLRSDGSAVDYVAMAQHAADFPPACLDFGGHVYLGEVGNAPVPIDAYMPNLLRSLRKRRVSREIVGGLRQAGEQLAQPMADLGRVGGALTQRVTRALDALTSEVSHSQAMADILTRITSGESKPYMPTGIQEIDEVFGGASRNGTTIILAQSGHLKTTLCNMLAMGQCLQGKSVYIHGTETPADRRREDMLYSLARVNGRVFSRAQGRARAQMADRLTAAAERIAGWDLHVSGMGEGVDEVAARGRRLFDAGQMDTMIVDYLQDFPGQANANGRTDHVIRCSLVLKDVAKDTGVPTFVAAQAGKQTLVDAIKNPRPGMWDAQWASQIPQDAEEVWVCYNDDKNRQEWGEAWRPLQAGRPNTLEVIKRKSRDDGPGTALLDFHGPTRWLGDQWFGWTPFPDEVY